MSHRLSLGVAAPWTPSCARAMSSVHRSASSHSCGAGSSAQSSASSHSSTAASTGAETTISSSAVAGIIAAIRHSASSKDNHFISFTPFTPCS